MLTAGRPGLWSNQTTGLVDLDAPKRLIAGLVRTEFTTSIRVLLYNPYEYKPFWYFYTGLIEEAEWKRKFAAAKRAAHRARQR